MWSLLEMTLLVLSYKTRGFYDPEKLGNTPLGYLPERWDFPELYILISIVCCHSSAHWDFNISSVFQQRANDSQFFLLFKFSILLSLMKSLYCGHFGTLEIVLSIEVSSIQRLNDALKYSGTSLLWTL